MSPSEKLNRRDYLSKTLHALHLYSAGYRQAVCPTIVKVLLFHSAIPGSILEQNALLETCHICHMKLSFLLTIHDHLPVLLDIKSN
jgi:hypothetical protein